MLYFRPNYVVSQTLVVTAQLDTIHKTEYQKGYRVVNITRANCEGDMWWVTSIRVVTVVKEMQRIIEENKDL